MLRIIGKCLMSNFQKLFQVKLNPEIFRFLTWNLEKVVKPINKSIKFPSVLEPPTLRNKSSSKGAFLYLCVMRFHEIILEVPFYVHANKNSWVGISILAYFGQKKYSFNFKAKIYIFLSDLFKADATIYRKSNFTSGNNFRFMSSVL